MGENTLGGLTEGNAKEMASRSRREMQRVPRGPMGNDHAPATSQRTIALKFFLSFPLSSRSNRNEVGDVVILSFLTIFIAIHKYTVIKTNKAMLQVTNS